MLRLLIVAAALLVPVGHAAADADFDRRFVPRQYVGVLCDTPQQVERFLVLLQKDLPRAAAAAVNAEVGKKDACLITTVTFRPVKTVARATNRFGDWRVVEAEIIAVLERQGQMRLLPPNQPHYYIVMAEEGHKI